VRQPLREKETRTVSKISIVHNTKKKYPEHLEGERLLAEYLEKGGRITEIPFGKTASKDSDLHRQSMKVLIEPKKNKTLKDVVDKHCS